MRIGLIGSGNMGRALGVRLAQSGHENFFGARSSVQAEDAAKLAANNSKHGSVDQAAGFGDVLIWTPREVDATRVLDDGSILRGKVIVDVDNRNYATDVRTGAWFEVSLAERLQNSLPDAQVVKAFNTIAMETFDRSAESLRSQGAQTFIAGRQAEAKRIVAEIASTLGFEAIDLGSSPAALRAIEALGDIIRLLMIEEGQGGDAHIKVIKLVGPTLGTIGTREHSKYE
ncbi:putative reductase [Acidisarcina polymorpha]|uniref:Putative reductase n=1 Tax=Acidisarcina polymorpha TaxID=2211140 RepID=A0A2Z5G516_9BACT|nr:NAD(P)-binding domain-containing protein [Acidisarcina polymorpha]AXC13857.1 putative reductase [Acidisarcina polymorpha]